MSVNINIMILLRDCDETLKAYVHIDHLTE